ncbi:Uncharacterised protein [Serratia quinivorans]|uniref:hypothetical protein n=1 Tax=Serratia quinivorans TaxID=137545 RepID=UPI00217AACDF|nr:hypothetical protein [Serratia quinivorans]CAI1502683.1 Uncharacterised protein [Serratia quinivorans]
MNTNRNEVLILSKIDVAERQLKQAIRLFFREEDPVSIRTLAEAAGQVFADIGKKEGIKGLVRDLDRIYPEYQKQWITAVFASRNFFKHADKDLKELHEFNVDTNDFAILDAICIYNSLKKEWAVETVIYWSWFGLKYPHLLKDIPENECIVKMREEGEFDFRKKLFFAKVIEAAYRGEITLPNINIQPSRNETLD